MCAFVTLNKKITYLLTYLLSGATVKAFDLRRRGRGFDSVRCFIAIIVTGQAVHFMQMCFCHPAV